MTHHIIRWHNADSIIRSFVTESAQDARDAYIRLQASPAVWIRWDTERDDCGIPPAPINDRNQARGNVAIRRMLRASGLNLPALPAQCLTSGYDIYRALQLLREACSAA